MARSPVDYLEDDPSPGKFILGLIAGSLITACYSSISDRYPNWAPPFWVFGGLMAATSLGLTIFTRWKTFAVGFLTSLPLSPLVFLATCFVRFGH